VGVLALGAGAGCGAGLPALSPQANSVRVGKDHPGADAQELGPVDGTNGSGCGIYGATGSYDGAVIDLRNRTAALGGNYVEIVTLVPPHLSGMCPVDTFAIHGIAYRGTEAQTTASQSLQSPPNASCDPPCSPGYSCSGAKCMAVCNPACAASEVCRPDRTCGPPS
jgi:hypothetical protein